MSHGSGRQVIFELAWMKLKRTRINAAIAAIFPAVVLIIWSQGSFDMAGKAFLFLLPHVFLFLSQDMAKDEIRSGALENVLFLRKRFKTYLLGKNIVLVLAGTLYAAALFVPFWVSGLVSRKLGWEFLLGFFVALLIGAYYIGLGGLLSYLFKAGSNVMALIVAQVGAFMVLCYSATQKKGLFDILETGTLSGFASKIKFMALVTVLPNVIVAVNLRRYLALVALLALAAFFFQKIIVQGLEIGRS